MAKSAAERQAAYRLRRNEGEGDSRLNTWITSSANFALDRLAIHYGVTKRVMLERLIENADDEIMKSMDETSSSNYIDAPLRKRWKL
jgi:hypothetical protein